MRADNIGSKWAVGAALEALVSAGFCGQAMAAKPRHKVRVVHHAVVETITPKMLVGSAPQPSSIQMAPAGAGGTKMSDAEKMRRLDIMLLVTGLRCRTTADDFQPDFEAFETKHRRDLNVADRQLRAEFGTRSGTAATAKEMDHINVEMANTYGNGHPWMGCHDLKGVVHDLASMTGPKPLLVVAEQLLGAPMIVAQP